MWSTLLKHHSSQDDQFSHPPGVGSSISLVFDKVVHITGPEIERLNYQSKDFKVAPNIILRQLY